MQSDSSKIGFAEAMVVTASVVAVLLFVVWQLATREVTPDVETLQDQVRFLSADLESMKNHLRRLQAREVVLEKETEVLRQANRLLRQYESERQEKLGRLQSELDFYGRLVGTGGALTGLDLYRAEIIPTESERVFQFILTLTQNIRQASIISGKAILEVEGTIGDRPATLHWPQLSDEETPEPEFRFKYFQQLEGYLSLPEGFSPTRLVVKLEAVGSKTPVARNYSWNELKSD